jgi:hypothetical protein
MSNVNGDGGRVRWSLGVTVNLLMLDRWSAPILNNRYTLNNQSASATTGFLNTMRLNQRQP